MTEDKFSQGINNAVRICMNVQEDDRVLIITDQQTLKIGRGLAEESSAAGASSQVLILEDFGPRPMTELPEDLIESLIDFLPTVTFYAAESLEGELKLRRALSERTRQAFNELGAPHPRHGHMVSITEPLISQGMTADYLEISRLTHQVLEIVKDAKKIEVTSVRGSEITAEFNPAYHWVPCHGLYHQPGDWGNLPEGEVFTCPETLNGILIADVLGDHFSSKYGVLEHPITIKVKDGLVTDAHCHNKLLEDEFLAYLDSATNGRRAGEFAIGTNTAVEELSGNLLQDEKIPGIHVAFGNPYSLRTGADWESSVHVDVVPIGCTILVDGKKIMENGKFTI